jgi:hypothetical protein
MCEGLASFICFIYICLYYHSCMTIACKWLEFGMNNLGLSAQWWERRWEELLEQPMIACWGSAQRGMQWALMTHECMPACMELSWAELGRICTWRSNICCHCLSAGKGGWAFVLLLVPFCNFAIYCASLHCFWKMEERRSPCQAG